MESKTVLEVRPHQWSIQWHNHFFWLVSCIVLSASQDTVGPFDHQGTLLAHCATLSLPSTKNPRFLPVVLHSSLLSPRLEVHSGLHSPRCRIQHFSLLNFIGDCAALYQDISVRPLYSQGDQHHHLFYYCQQTYFIYTQVLCPGY